MISTTTENSGRGRRLFLLPPLLILLFFLLLFVGSVSLDPLTVMRVLVAGDGQEPARTILLNFRLPRGITATLVGGALALAGLTMQTHFRNPLAGPGVLGVTSGAGLAVAVVVLTGAGRFLPGGGSPVAVTTSASAILGAATVLAVILLVSRVITSPTTLLVLGVLFGYATSALVTLLMAGSSPESLDRYIRWSYGSFDVALTPLTGFLGLLLLLGALLLFLLGPQLDTTLLGPRYALSSGVPLRAVSALLLGVAGALTGVATAISGPIAFVGVAVPHLARLLLGSASHRLIIPATLLLGGSLALAADIIAHLPFVPGVLPINAVTALVGVPVIVAVLLRPGGRRREITL